MRRNQTANTSQRRRGDRRGAVFLVKCEVQGRALSRKRIAFTLCLVNNFTKLLNLGRGIGNGLLRGVVALLEVAIALATLGLKLGFESRILGGTGIQPALRLNEGSLVTGQFFTDARQAALGHTRLIRQT